MRVTLAIVTFIAAVSSAAVERRANDQLAPCNFNLCIGALGQAGINCQKNIFSGKLVDCVGDLLDTFTKNTVECKGCFDAPHNCQLAGENCPAIGATYQQCLNHCARYIFPGASGNKCTVWCQNTCGC